jgi:hypothetical protein
VLTQRIAQWALYFEANPAAAIEAKSELQATRQLDDHPHKQLGLSVALTPAEHRCQHYGDERYCPQCLTT